MSSDFIGSQCYAGSVNLTAEEIIRLLELKPLTIEGGFFRETYRCTATSGIAHLQRTALFGHRNLLSTYA
jgi:predicted cupin superfamily sugar epimerase